MWSTQKSKCDIYIYIYIFLNFAMAEVRDSISHRYEQILENQDLVADYISSNNVAASSP